jgi:putative methyltransferase
VLDVVIVCLNNLPFLPYVHGVLRAAVEADPVLAGAYRFQEPVFLAESPEHIFAGLQQPTVVGLSCYVWNFKRHMKLARLIKQYWAETLVVAGGPHIPDDGDDLLREHPYVDILVHGEGELAFRGLLHQRLAACPEWSYVPGISFRAAGRAWNTGPGEKLPKEISLRSPYQAGYLSKAIEVCRERGLRFYAPWETNRGCPFQCTFCDWGAATMSKVRRFAERQLLTDIDFFGRERIPNVFICDANFGMLARDIELASALTQANERYGYPKQVRVNFAKNSGQRVFEISRMFAAHEMLMGTTLSMQSTDDGVLHAIQRQNIDFGDLRALKLQYSRAGIHTYTELILGLPLETKESFKEGIGQILAAGNHEDLRVYELTLLPNAPLNHPSERARYKLRTIEKRIFEAERNVPTDEIEVAPLVFESSTLSKADWIECSVFAQMIQCLHNGCFTRYIAIYLDRAHGLGYRAFYDRLIGEFEDRPETVLGGILRSMRKLYQLYVDDPSIPQLHLVASQTELMDRLKRYGRRRAWRVDDWAWLCVSEDQDRFYEELHHWLESLHMGYGKELVELLAYQADLMLRPNYDPAVGKRVTYAYDFPSYFVGNEALSCRRVTIHWADRAMGVNRQYPLIPGDLESFAQGALGESYPFSRIRHYTHQIDAARISFHSLSEFPIHVAVDCHS